MRIVILANSDIGLFKFRKEIVDRLCRHHTVYIVLPDGEFIKPLKALGCIFIPFEFNRRGINPFVDLGQLIRYRKLLEQLEPDVVLTYTIKPNVYGGIVCQLCKIPYIENITGLGTAIENGGLISIVSTTLYRVALRKANCVFFQNDGNKQQFISKRIVAGKSRLIPGSGVNLKNHAIEPYPSDNNTRFLFVGRIMKDKGIEELLVAIRKLHRDREDVTLDIVGWCDENYSDALKEAVDEGAVRYHGMQTDVHSFYTACHCVVLPSYHEGMANVMLEASSTGRPVITTRVPGCQETFDEGVTGFGCEAGDAESLIQAMQKFINLPRDRRREMGLAARKKMENEFDRDIVIQAYLEEIEACALPHPK